MGLTREKLYEEVWAEPMTKVAARYNVSSSFLARVCKRLNVPRPERGYWAQLVVGKAPPKPDLPEVRPGDELEWSRDGEPRRVPRALPKPPEEVTQSARHLRRIRPARHDLLVGAREHFEAARESDSGYLRPTKRRLVDVFATKGTLDRALDVVNTLFLALEDRGHRVTFAPLDQHLQRPVVDERSQGGRERYNYGNWAPDRPTIVYVGTVAIGLTIFELSEEVDVRYVNGKYLPADQDQVPKRRAAYAHDWVHKRDMPSGRLCLRASSPYGRARWEKQWHEATGSDLNSKVPHIVRELEAEAATIARLVAEGQRQAEIERREWEAQHERWQREEAERRRVQHIKESREQLFAIIQAWGLAKQIEGFFEDAERRAADRHEEDREALLDRLHRARALLGGVDALQRFLGWKAPEER
jgi:hypothetical protein